MAGLETISAEAARMIAGAFAEGKACPLAGYLRERLAGESTVLTALDELEHAPDDGARHQRLRRDLLDVIATDPVLAVDVDHALAQGSTGPLRGFTGLLADAPCSPAGPEFSILVSVRNPFDVPITVHRVRTPVPAELLDVGRPRTAPGGAIAVGTDLPEETFNDLMMDRSPIFGDVFTEDGRQAPFAAVAYATSTDERSLRLNSRLRRALGNEREAFEARLEPGSSLVWRFVLRIRSREPFRSFEYTLQVRVEYSAEGGDYAGTIPYRLRIGSANELDEVRRELDSYDADTTDFETWTARLALQVLLQETLADPEIARAMAKERVQAAETREAVLADGSVLARIRIEQDRLVREGRGGGEPASRAASLTLPQCGWLVLAAAFGVGYLSVLRFSWPRMPFPWQLLSILGFVAVLVLSLRLVARRVPEFLGIAGWREIGAIRPDPALLGLGGRYVFVREEIVVPAVREFIRSQRTPRYETKLVYTEITGLYEEDESKIVLTGAAKRLRRIIERADSGAVALAGYRGVGKTTAIRAMRRGLFSSTESDSPPLVVIASAPAHYDARDFVLHLHALLCTAVITKLSAVLGSILPPARGERWKSLWCTLKTFVRFLVFAIICVGGAALLWGGGVTRFPLDVGNLLAAATADLPRSLPTLWSGQRFTRLAALVLLGFVAGMIVWAVLRLPWSVAVRVRGRRRHGELCTLLREAKKELAQTRFLQTHTTGWSGKLSMPLNGGAGRTWSTQRAEQQLTHPEVVEKLRRFAETSARTLREEGVTDRMVIAIDELDKIGEQEKAHQFVNDLKGVFGVPGCLFFVSVSDDAVLNFEQRGLGVRDAFDSAFAEMVRLEHFTLDESRLWIALRLGGVPDQFCYLCHCLSGGLPRDLRRHTTDMVDVTTDAYQPSLSVVTETLVRTECVSKMHAFRGKLTTLDPSPEQVGLAAQLLTITETLNPLELADKAGRLVRQTGGPASPTDALRWHAGCFSLFSATILEIFDDDLDQAGLTPDLHQLAVARREMAMHPQLAWQRLQDFRKARGLETGADSPVP